MRRIKNFLSHFWRDEEGLETLEILLILAVLVGVALLFGNKIIEWVNGVIKDIKPTPPKVPGGTPGS